MIDVELEVVLYRVFDAARKARHRFVTPEHLLYRLLDRKAVVTQLEANSVRIDELRGRLRDYLRKAPAFPASCVDPDTEPTLELQRTIQRAARAARADGRGEVTVLDLLSVLSDPGLGLGVAQLLRGAAALDRRHGLRSGREQPCALCDAETTPDAWTDVKGRGVLCPACVDAVLAARRSQAIREEEL
jgi:ATP-dependent Clp protease ATP-binding subunit ClpA